MMRLQSGHVTEPLTAATPPVCALDLMSSSGARGVGARAAGGHGVLSAGAGLVLAGASCGRARSAHAAPTTLRPPPPRARCRTRDVLPPAQQRDLQRGAPLRVLGLQVGARLDQRQRDLAGRVLVVALAGKEGERGHGARAGWQPGGHRGARATAR
jgi:hypothetical protein